tara:strand:- start:1902 stop:2369 length:468 start_codon:yes stop_codon:yes gene_type:complete
MKLTEAGRIQTARTFLLCLCQQLTTFSLWASNDGTGLKMTDDDKRKQVKYLEKRLRELERGLEESVRACLNVMKKEMNDQIFDKYPDLINEAINAAPVTAQSWGAHRSDGGLGEQNARDYVNDVLTKNSLGNLQGRCSTRWFVSFVFGRPSRLQL